LLPTQYGNFWMHPLTQSLEFHGSFRNRWQMT